MSNEVFQQQVSQPVKQEIPVESISLPSQGKVYSQEHPLYNAESVEIKCMSAKEEDILTSRALIKQGTVLTQLMKSILPNKLIDPDTLLVGDRNAILIAARISGYGPQYSAKVGCSSCSEEFDYEFNLSGLKIKSLSVEPVQSNINLFSFVLPSSNKQIQFKLLTGKDELELSKEQEKKKKLGMQLEEGVTSRLFKSIVAIEGETDKGKLKSIILNMRAGDARALRKFVNNIEPDVDLKQTIKCPLCGEEEEVEIPLNLQFFWPDA